MSKQVALIVLDGWGYREDLEHNAVATAKTPYFDSLWNKYSHGLLEASGLHVGLPEGQIGNSEIGHMTIGAGKVIDTDLVRINKSISDNSFSENEVFEALFNQTRKNNSKLHVLGLIGKGGVHSHQDHLLEFLKVCKNKNIEQVYLHLFTDGRDASPYESIKDVEEIKTVIKEVGIGEICSISGRYFAMDRDNNWDRVEQVEKIIFHCEGNICQVTPEEEIQAQHATGKTDEHIEPFIVHEMPISNGDAVFFFNYRADRARMLTERILARKDEMNLFFATLTEYSKNYECAVAFPPIAIETTIANEVSIAGLTQAHIAESEKFPHATYFLNGGKEEPHDGEEHVMLASRKDVKTHDEAPEMRAEGIADEAIKRLEDGVNFIFINFANPDMVGHTANVPAIVTAVETVDRELKRVLDVLHARAGVAFVTADHGNAEVNFDADKNEKHTAHTLNRVPAIITREGIQMMDGSLADIAPTILNLLELEKPKSMTGEVLFK
ncbi:MAG: 2,3-bisphosphoglycerate-independent phosphoglycerate mutase [Candidatus Pacebacteria bacterium]|nr:2,3-bisphosphoglycerate-independent phosphoglycerate mutase [Candidatus Paceibacterota bacterium]